MRQNQVIAIEKGARTKAERALTDAHHKLQKADLLTGLTRSYTPRDEQGEELPDEQKLVQVRVTELLEGLVAPLGAMFDVTATKVRTNQNARADVVVNGTALFAGAPVELLLFLEKQLVNLHTFVAKLPVLDPSEEWAWSGARNCWATKVKKQVRTRKVLRNHVKALATPEHPEQVECFTEDEQIGTWEKVEFSGAMPAAERAAMLGRVQELQVAVKQAREAANMIEATVEKGLGEAVLRFIYGGD